MKIIDNLNNLLGDELQQTLTPNTKLKIAASCFSIYAYEALKKELAKIDSLEFIFTSPTFVADEVTDKFKKEKREFFIPKAGRERSLYGTDFEIQLKNKLTQKAIAKECANWIRKKATFKSNKTDSPMQSFVVTEAPRQQTETMSAVFAPVSGFTAVDLGYQRGNAISNFVQKIDEPNFTAQ
ncbi:TPA: ATP-dependent helicase, partial [Escherichia coli]